MQNNKLLIAIVVVNLISSLIASTYLITLQFDAQRRSLVASQQREELKRQNDLLVCILQINPMERTSETVAECRANTIGGK